MNLPNKWNDLRRGEAGHLDGRKTLSIQFFDRSGHAAFKVFLGFAARIPPEKEVIFGQVREEFRKG